jgi:hypothetical protein
MALEQKNLSMLKTKFVVVAHDNHGILRHQNSSNGYVMPSPIHELMVFPNFDDGCKNIKLSSCQNIWGCQFQHLTTFSRLASYPQMWFNTSPL